MRQQEVVRLRLQLRFLFLEELFAILKHGPLITEPYIVVLAVCSMHQIDLKYVSGQRTILIHFVHHFLQLFLCGVLSQHPHHLPQLLCANAAIFCILHEDVKGSAELCQRHVNTYAHDVMQLTLADSALE